MNRLPRLLVVCFTAVCIACAAPNPGSNTAPTFDVDIDPTGPTPWTSLDAKDDPDTFHFVVVTDRTGGHRPGVFKGAMPKINLLAPAFVVSVGDLIEGYTDNQARIDAEWDEMEGFIGTLDAPFFYTAGNHDMNNAVMAETWQRRFGPSFYKFRYKGVLFLVLNSELFGMVGAPDTPLPGPWTQAQQMQFIEQTLSEEANARWTVVLLHQPLWDAREVDSDWLKVEELLGSRQYTVFAGHFHQYAKRRRNDRSYITLATTGGGSGLRGTPFGEFDHVAWVTMTADGPVIANLLLEGIHGEDVSTPELAAAAQELMSSIRSDPGVATVETFSRATQQVRIENPTDAAIRLVPHVSRPSNFEISGLRALELAPGESATLDLGLRAQEPLPYRDLVAAEITWRVEADLGTIAARTAVLPLTKHPIPTPQQAPTIDGDLTDWPTLPFSVTVQGDIFGPAKDPADSSYRFAVSADADALYVAVDVTDDDLVHDAQALARDQDAISLTIDVRDEAARNRSMLIGEAVLGGDMAQLAMMIRGLDTTAEDKLLGFMRPTIDASEAAIVRTSTGYRAEFAVPMQHLNDKAGRDDWSEARIVVSVYDKDTGDHGATSLHWQPYRYNNGAMPWTHTFTR